MDYEGLSPCPYPPLDWKILGVGGWGEEGDADDRAVRRTVALNQGAANTEGTKVGLQL